MSTATLPSTREEDWRYSDIKALEPVWNKMPATERIDVADGGHDSLVIEGVETVDGVGVRSLDIHIGKDARFDLHLLLSEADYGRVALTVTLASGAHFELGGAILGAGEQTLEIVSDVIHAEPDATSNQVVRSVLADTATGSVLNRVRVVRDAQRTDAVQSIKAMLLDRGATANAKPELEIYADDVKCAHGATVGELDKQALFYLASRGLPPAKARQIMLQAFIADAFVEIGDDSVREALENKAKAALEALT